MVIQGKEKMMSVMKTKICNKCKKEKEESEYSLNGYYSDGKRKRRRATCKDCTKKYRDYKIEYYQRKKGRREPEGITSKKCKDCKKEKEFKYFVKNILGKYGYHARCKDCYSIDRKNRPKLLKYQKDYRNKPEYKKKMHTYWNKYQEIGNDAYIKTLIVPSTGKENITRKDITPEMLEIKRKHLELWRIRNNKSKLNKNGKKENK